MTSTPARRLRELELWPVWRLRRSDVRSAPAGTAIDRDADEMTAASSTAPTQTMPPTAVHAAMPADVDTAPDIASMDWEQLETAVRACTRCPLSASRTQGVPGVGDRRAEWLFIGEAPGAEEDRLGEPFVGQAGKLLDAMLAAIGLERGRNVYIANVLKSRPPGNRDPRPEETAACLPYLERQIELMRPRLIVALGRIAAQSLLLTDTPIGRLRGHVHTWRGVPMVVTYHPAYLLRNAADKAKAWEDLLLARRTLHALRQAESG